MSVVDGRTPGNDIWSHFADFLSELIARHAEELDIDSWPDPKKVIMFQDLQDVYLRFIRLSLQARKEAVKTERIYGIVRIYRYPALRRKHHDHQRAHVSDHGRTRSLSVQIVKNDRDLYQNDQRLEEQEDQSRGR